jgi:hypothetical protein
MAVCTPDCAFVDLRAETLECRPIAYEQADLALLLAADMIELHDDGIREAAVGTRMLRKICVDERTIPRASRREQRPAAFMIDRRLAVMIRAPIRTPARRADRVHTSGALVTHRKIALIAFFAASPTSLHEDSVRSAGASRLAR